MYGRLGDSGDVGTIPGFTPAVVADSGSINWNDVIQSGLQIVNESINGQPVPTRYPTYTPTTTAFGASNLMPLLLIGGIFLLASHGRR